MKIRFLDVLALVLVTAAIGAVSVRAYSRGNETAAVRIEASGKTWIYPSDHGRTVEVAGPIGITKIQIGSGHARVVDSPCRDKLCVHMGEISKPGQWAACLPNRVFVRIGEAGDDVVDDSTF